MKINTAPRVRAADELRRALEKLDWSGLTPGRRRILEAFIELASSEGYAAVSMRSLGAKVGVKAPSIYSHFPGGRDEVVTEAFRWHFSRFAAAILEAVDSTDSAGDFWNAMVRVHLRRQLESPENDAWDMLRTLDRMNPFLQPDTRTEVDHWVGLYEDMYTAAARELGYAYDEVEKLVKVVVKVLDTAHEWCGWVPGDEGGLEICVAQAVVITRSMLSIDLAAQED